jgi:hypothetical protein
MKDKQKELTEKQQLLEELEEKFEELRKKVGFKMTLEELDEIFSVKDYIIHIGYVRGKFFHQLNQIICDYFNSWQNYLVGLMFPTHDYLIRQTESKLFSSEEDKKKIWVLIKNSMKFVSMGSVIVLNKSDSLEKEFVENSYSFCKNSFIPELLKIAEKIHANWKNN